MQIKNKREDIGSISGVVPRFRAYTIGGAAGRAADQIGVSTVGPAGIYENTFTTVLNVGDPVTLTITISGWYRMSHTFVINFNPSETGTLGAGFTLNGSAQSNLIAFHRIFQPASAGNQHGSAHCATERYLNAGDTISFVSLLDSAPSFTSGSEQSDNSSIEFVG